MKIANLLILLTAFIATAAVGGEAPLVEASRQIEADIPHAFLREVIRASLHGSKEKIRQELSSRIEALEETWKKNPPTTSAPLQIKFVEKILDSAADGHLEKNFKLWILKNSPHPEKWLAWLEMVKQQEIAIEFEVVVYPNLEKLTLDLGEKRSSDPKTLVETSLRLKASPQIRVKNAKIAFRNPAVSNGEPVSVPVNWDWSWVSKGAISLIDSPPLEVALEARAVESIKGIDDAPISVAVDSLKTNLATSYLAPNDVSEIVNYIFNEKRLFELQKAFTSTPAFKQSLELISEDLAATLKNQRIPLYLIAERVGDAYKINATGEKSKFEMLSSRLRRDGKLLFAGETQIPLSLAEFKINYDPEFLLWNVYFKFPKNISIETMIHELWLPSLPRFEDLKVHTEIPGWKALDLQKLSSLEKKQLFVGYRLAFDQWKSDQEQKMNLPISRRALSYEEFTKKESLEVPGNVLKHVKGLSESQLDFYIQYLNRDGIEKRWWKQFEGTNILKSPAKVEIQLSQNEIIEENRADLGWRFSEEGDLVLEPDSLGIMIPALDHTFLDKIILSIDGQPIALEPQSQLPLSHQLWSSVMRQLKKENRAPTVAGAWKVMEDEISDEISHQIQSLGGKRWLKLGEEDGDFKATLEIVSFDGKDSAFKCNSVVLENKNQKPIPSQYQDLLKYLKPQETNNLDSLPQGAESFERLGTIDCEYQLPYQMTIALHDLYIKEKLRKSIDRAEFTLKAKSTPPQLTIKFQLTRDPKTDRLYVTRQPNQKEVTSLESALNEYELIKEGEGSPDITAVAGTGVLARVADGIQWTGVFDETIASVERDRVISGIETFLNEKKSFLSQAVDGVLLKLFNGTEEGRDRFEKQDDLGLLGLMDVGIFGFLDESMKKQVAALDKKIPWRGPISELPTGAMPLRSMGELSALDFVREKLTTQVPSSYWPKVLNVYGWQNLMKELKSNLTDSLTKILPMAAPEIEAQALKFLKQESASTVQEKMNEIYPKIATIPQPNPLSQYVKALDEDKIAFQAPQVSWICVGSSTGSDVMRVVADARYQDKEVKAPIILESDSSITSRSGDDREDTVVARVPLKVLEDSLRFHLGIARPEDDPGIQKQVLEVRKKLEEEIVSLAKQQSFVNKTFNFKILDPKELYPSEPAKWDLLTMSPDGRLVVRLGFKIDQGTRFGRKVGEEIFSIGGLIRPGERLGNWIGSILDFPLSAITSVHTGDSSAEINLDPEFKWNPEEGDMQNFDIGASNIKIEKGGQIKPLITGLVFKKMREALQGDMTRGKFGALSIPGLEEGVKFTLDFDGKFKGDPKNPIAEIKLRPIVRKSTQEPIQIEINGSYRAPLTSSLK